MLNILYSNSLKGRVKESNQDAYLVKPFDNGDMLLAVADGMGGGVMGAELADRAMEILDRIFDDKSDYPLQKLKQAIFVVNDELSVMLDGQKGGTTLSMVYYQQGEIFYLNIGDSRVWLSRNGEIINLTLDQNIYEYKRLNNIYTDSEDKRLIYRILGISSNFEIEEILDSDEWSAFGSFELEEGDILVLSTDGFHDYMGRGLKSTNNITKYKHGLKSMLQDNQYGLTTMLLEIEAISNDNITAIVAKETR